MKIKDIHSSMWRHWSCLCCYQNKPAGDPCGSCGWLGAHGHRHPRRASDPCVTVFSNLVFCSARNWPFMVQSNANVLNSVLYVAQNQIGYGFW